MRLERCLQCGNLSHLWVSEHSWCATMTHSIDHIIEQSLKNAIEHHEMWLEGGKNLRSFAVLIKALLIAHSWWYFQCWVAYLYPHMNAEIWVAWDGAWYFAQPFLLRSDKNFFGRNEKKLRMWYVCCIRFPFSLHSNSKQLQLLHLDTFAQTRYQTATSCSSTYPSWVANCDF